MIQIEKPYRMSRMGERGFKVRVMPHVFQAIGLKPGDHYYMQQAKDGSLVATASVIEGLKQYGRYRVTDTIKMTIPAEWAAETGSAEKTLIAKYQDKIKGVSVVRLMQVV